MNVFKRITKGSFVQGSALLIMLAGAEGPYATKWGVFGAHLTGIPLWVFGVLASAGGILFFLWPMIFGSEPAPRTEEAAKSSQRMLFLYLRPFALDARNILQLLVGASAGALVYTGMLDGVWWVLSFAPLVINISKEQAFKDAFERVGDFITFGKPNERLRPIGASRVYAGGDWQQEILRYMAQAKLVIVRPGRAPSIRWEVEQVLQQDSPERVVFYLHFRGWKKSREKVYEEFRSLFQRIHPDQRLPERLKGPLYLIFDSSWNPYFVREASRPDELIGQLISHSGDVTVDRLRPVLNALNIDIPRPPNTMLNKVMTVFTWLAAIFAAGLVMVALAVAIIRIMSALVLSLLN
ncbi:MAG TPA: hypothetical protein VJ464_17545 [Blastocatellia bacterium]|nr:hypothetical protein [Blastocatellia bacterium]